MSFAMSQSFRDKILTAVIVVKYSKHAVFTAKKNTCAMAKLYSKVLIDIADGLHVRAYQCLPKSSKSFSSSVEFAISNRMLLANSPLVGCPGSSARQEYHVKADHYASSAVVTMPKERQVTP